MLSFVYTSELAPGEYRLVVNLDGVAHTCPFVLPDDMPGPSDAGSLPCSPALYYSVINGPCEDEFCEDAPSQFTFGTFETPNEVAVRIERDGEQIFDESRSVEYRRTYPNGPACGPTCLQSVVSFGP